MAKPTKSNKDDSSSNPHAYNICPTPSILASCYTVNASTMALKGFHYSSTGAGGTRSLPPCLVFYLYSSSTRQLNVRHNADACGFVGARWYP